MHGESALSEHLGIVGKHLNMGMIKVKKWLSTKVSAAFIHLVQTTVMPIIQK